MELDQQLVQAVLKGQTDEVERLLDQGADASVLDEHGYGLPFRAVNAAVPDLKRIVRLLVEHGADLDRVSSYGESALKSAAMRPPFDIVQVLLDLGADENLLDWSPLHRAIALEDEAAVARELAQDPPLWDKDCWNRTPWHLAIQTGDLAKARALLPQGGDPNAPGHCGNTPLMYALQGDHLPMFEWLLSEGADPDATNEFRERIGGIAVESGAASCLPLLLERGWATVDLIAESSDEATIGILLDAGGDIDAISGEGYSLLMVAAEAGDEDRIRFLLGKRANPNATSTGEAALHKAISQAELKIARLLIEAGADVNQPDVDGDAPLAFARSKAAIDLLTEAGASPEQPGSLGTQIDTLQQLAGEELATYAQRLAEEGGQGASGELLHAAACRRDLALMHEFLAQGPSADAPDREGHTPLHWLASRDQKWDAAGRSLRLWAEQRGRSLPETESALDECIDALLKHGATVDARDRGESTALLAAMQWEQGDAARSLIERGAAVAVCDVTGWTPVLLAANRDDVEILDFLLANGGSLDDARDGWSALHYAVHHGKRKMVRHLLELGMDPNRRHASGRLDMPVHCAAFMGRTDILRVLLDAGAQPSPVDGEGKTPRDYAIEEAADAREMEALMDGMPPDVTAGIEPSASAARFDEIVALLDERSATSS